MGLRSKCLGYSNIKGFMGYQSEPLIALIVEDDPWLLALMEVALEQMSIRFVSSQSAEAALAIMLIRGREIGIVISDIRLGGAMDGIDFAREVRSRWPKLPFVITSGNPGTRLIHQPPDLLFLPKPWQISDFITTTKSALQSADHISR
jgi:DNA-binding NtrC family response regulator